MTSSACGIVPVGTTRGLIRIAATVLAVSSLTACVSDRRDWTLSVSNDRASPIVVRISDRGGSSEWAVGAISDSLLVKLDHPLDGAVVILDAADCTVISRPEPMPTVGDVWLFVRYLDPGDTLSAPVEVVRRDGPTMDTPDASPSVACP